MQSKIRVLRLFYELCVGLRKDNFHHFWTNDSMLRNL